MITQVINITTLKGMSTPKLVELLSASNVIVTSGGSQITLMSAIDNTYGSGAYGK